jgi:hypothetical protein
MLKVKHSLLVVLGWSSRVSLDNTKSQNLRALAWSRTLEFCHSSILTFNYYMIGTMLGARMCT